MKEINLIGGQKKKLFRFYRQIKLLKTAVVVLNFIFVLVMGGFLLIYANTAKTLKSNEAKIAVLKNEISKLNKRETYLAIADNRLAGIDGIFKDRLSQTGYLSKIKELFVEGYSFSVLETGSHKRAKLTGSCFDSQCLASLYAKAEELKENKAFSGFIFNDLSRKLNTPFEIGISLVY